MMSGEIMEKARHVKLLIVDIDGVMTDGRIVYSIYGDELKFFDVTDGFGISLLNRAGIKTIMVSIKVHASSSAIINFCIVQPHPKILIRQGWRQTKFLL